jgi:hypothetical protein
VFEAFILVVTSGNVQKPGNVSIERLELDQAPQRCRRSWREADICWKVR